MKTIKEHMKSVYKDKRGLSLGDMYPAVLTIVLIGIVVGNYFGRGDGLYFFYH